MIEINNKKICESCFSEITSEPCSCCGFNKSTYINDPSVLPCGSILMGRYIVGKMLGKGGFGITYLAYDSKTDNTVAVKEFYPNGLANRAGGNPTVTVSTSEDASVFQKGAEKFYSEAKLVARFNGNPGIVSVYEFFYENDTVYFSMEYLHGKTLKKHIDENGPITEAQAVSVADSVSSALLAAHSANVMHRDISPDNIMLCDDGTVKIIDFGAARQLVSQGSQNLSVILKQGFAPIEQYQKKGNQGPWTDIYSLGATLYYALTLDTIDDPMSRMENDEEFQSNRHGISEPLWNIIRTATMLKAADRYQDIFLFRNALSASGISPDPIIPLQSDDVESGFKFQTAQPFNSRSINTISGPNVTAPLEPSAPQQTDSNSGNINSALGVTAALEQPDPQPLNNSANTNSDLNVTVAMDSPDVKPAIPVSQVEESKPSKKKPGMIIGIAAACVVVLGIGTAVLVSVLNKNDDITPSSGDIISQSDTVSDSPVTTPKTTTGKTTIHDLPSQPEDKPWSPDSESDTTTPALPEQPGNKPWSPDSESDTTTPALPEQPGDTPWTPSEPEEITEVEIGGKDYSVDTKILDLGSRGLTTADIKNLKYMTSLTHINLNDNNIDDLSVLAGITTLQQIEANNNNITDISFVSKLSNLGIVIMNNNNVSDISPLKNCKNLKKLWLVDNPVNDISALKGKNMLEIGFNNAPITDISALKGMTNLYQLHLYNCNISDISVLSTCVGLKTVYLDYNNISDYSALTTLQVLEVVNLNGNLMDENIIKTLHGLTFYIGLSIQDMGITDEMGYELCQYVYSDNPDAWVIW